MTNKLKSGCGGPIVEGDHSLQNLLKKIGKGPKLAKDLSREEAKAAMLQILDGEALPEQIGAFLIAERIKYESVEETTGFVEALRERSSLIQTDLPKLLELASAHDGKNKSLVLTPFVALALATAGLPTVVTGADNVPTKKGICAAHIFSKLGIKTNHSAKEIKQSLEKTGIAYWDTSQFCASLENLKPMRTNLGLRTGLNTVEKIINPANATHLCTGVFHGPYLQTVVYACQILNYQNVLSIQATEASTDLHLKKRCFFRQLKEGAVSEQNEIDPALYGYTYKNNPEFKEITAKSNTDQVLAALENQSGIIYDALVYNVAVQLWFTETVSKLDDGIKKAKTLLTTNNILQKIEEMKR
jgi:anthranilate phosphoribosyltransferase